MQRFGFVRSLLPAAGVVALALGAACGDDNGGGQPDGNVPPPDVDAGADVDAEPEPETTRASVVALRDVTVTNPDAEENNRGGNATIDFLDLEASSYNDRIGDSPLGGCQVTTYGATDRIYADEGPVTVSGTNVGDEDGSFVCSFDDVVGAYRCVLAEGADTDATLVYDDSIGDSHEVRLTLADTDLSGYNLIGGHVELDGFDDEFLDGTSFPIIGQELEEVENEATLLLRPQDFNGDEDAAAEGGSFRVVYGIGDGHFAGNTSPFLPGSETGETTISVSKPDGAVVEGFEVQVDPLGDGMALATGDKNGVPYIQPHDFPLPAEGETTVDGNAMMACGEDRGEGDGNCGIVPDEPASTLSAFIIDGRTTDAPLDEVGDHTIPDPVEEWAIFNCAFLGGDEGTLTEEAMNTVLSTNPTRIRMRAMHVSGRILNNEDGSNELYLLVGHELVGYTDWVRDTGE